MNLPNTTVRAALTARSCPFCKSVDHRVWIDQSTAHVSCKTCGASGPVIEVEWGELGPLTANAVDAAVKRWDRRK